MFVCMRVCVREREGWAARKKKVSRENNRFKKDNVCVYMRERRRLRKGQRKRVIHLRKVMWVCMCMYVCV